MLPVLEPAIQHPVIQEMERAWQTGRVDTKELAAWLLEWMTNKPQIEQRVVSNKPYKKYKMNKTTEEFETWLTADMNPSTAKQYAKRVQLVLEGKLTIEELATACRDRRIPNIRQTLAALNYLRAFVEK